MGEYVVAVTHIEATGTRVLPVDLGLDPDQNPAPEAAIDSVHLRPHSGQQVRHELALGLSEAATEHAIIATDATGTMEIFNRGAESMLAYARADAIGSSIERLYVPEQVRAALAEDELGDTSAGRLQALVGGAGPGRPAVRDWTYVRSDGIRVPVEVTVTRRPGLEQGVEPGYLFLATDVTRRREAEWLQDEFIGTISHELRTPLSSVLGYVELLGLDESLTGEQRRWVDAIERNARRLLRLVDDLRISVQVSAGTLRVAPEAVNLATVVRSAARDIVPVAKAAGVRLEVDASAEMIVRADPVRLDQAFENLLSNGIKFTRRGGRVTIGVRDGMLAEWGAGRRRHGHRYRHRHRAGGTGPAHRVVLPFPHRARPANPRHRGRAGDRGGDHRGPWRDA